MVIKSTVKGTYNEKIPIENWQKTVDAKIEESHPYRAELVQIISKIGFLTKNYRPTTVGVLYHFYVNILSIYIYINYITVVAIQTVA